LCDVIIVLNVTFDQFDASFLFRIKVLLALKKKKTLLTPNV